MFNKKGKAILLSITGAFLLSLLPNFESNVDNQVEADNFDNTIEKISYTETNSRDASENYTMLDDNEGLGVNSNNNTNNTDIGKEADIVETVDENEIDSKSVDTEKSDNSVQDAEVAITVPNKNTGTVNDVKAPSQSNESEKTDNIVGKTDEKKGTEVTNKIDEIEEMDDTPANNTPLRPQLMKNSEPIGVFMYGEKYSYYGDMNNLQFRKSSGEVMDVYVGIEYHLDENYIDVTGQSRKAIVDSYNGMTIVNKVDNGGYSIYMLYQK